MVELYSNIFIGTVQDYDKYAKNSTEFSSVGACKEPMHRQALGYTGRACDKNNPEYLFCYRPNILILNLVDANSSEYIGKELIDEAVKYISAEYKKGKKILIFCNKGESRSPTIGLLYLATKGFFIQLSYDEAKAKFQKCYPLYNPNKGIDDFARSYWKDYMNGNFDID